MYKNMIYVYMFLHATMEKWQPQNLMREASSLKI